MPGNILAQLAFIFPELLLALGAIALLLYGAFLGNNAYKNVIFSSIALILIALIIVLKMHYCAYIFNGALKLTLFNRFLKILILMASFFCLILLYAYNKFEVLDKFELPILYLFAIFGMLLMVTASNLLSLYFGLEIQSLSLYALAAFDRNNSKSSEAGMKYFILGSLSSAMLLYGMSIIYGYTGHLDYAGIMHNLRGGMHNIGLIFGITFVLCAVAFKISAVPFHMWTPDVYEGAPILVTCFFMTCSKIAAVGMLLNLIFQIFNGLPGMAEALPPWRQIIAILAIASMFLGAFGAIGQTNIKRFLAYGSINHVGYILLTLFATSKASISALLIYLSIYVISIIGCFAFMLAIGTKRENENIFNLSGMARNNLPLAVAMSLYLFSMAGIPPLAGFFAKWYVISAVIKAGYTSLAILAVLASAISAFYYIRIIKIMWFDEVKSKTIAPVGETKILLYITAFLLVTYVVIAPWLYKEAFIAASSLFLLS